jgi:enamine deaminase RidA (YjgF/YER057c/UK114 family)
VSLTAIIPKEFPWLKTDGYTFSLGLAEDNGAWLSGMSASRFDPSAGRVVVTGGMGEQAELAYMKIMRILEAAGLSAADVTRVTECVTASGIGHYTEAEEVRRRVFGSHEPAVVTVCVDRLLRAQALIEVEVSASAGGGLGLADGVREGFGGTVYLPTILPVGTDGELVQGGLAKQYQACLERAAVLLAGVGLGLESIVRTVDFTTPATRDSYRSTGRSRAELLGQIKPTAAGILMTRLPLEGALVSMDVVASRHEPVIVNPGWPRYETLTYNPGIRAGRMLWMSGFGALDLATQEVIHEGDVVAQARATYESIRSVLTAAGASPDAIVSTVEYVAPAGLKEYRGVAEVRRELLSPPWPASTGIVCAALLRPELMLEVVPTAVLE